MNEIPAIIKKCGSLNIKPQLLLNATSGNKLELGKAFLGKVLSYIKKLRDSGLQSVVAANPIYIGKIKKEISDITIESSVNCYVKTVEHALYLADLGVDILTIDRDINRNIPLIKEIKNRTGLKIRLMLNEGCISNCPYRATHYNYLSGGFRYPAKITEGVFWDKFCLGIYLNDPAKVFRIPFIPPEALTYYEQFIDYYKLSTRGFSTERIEVCLKAYGNKYFSGNLLDILDSPGGSYFEYIDYDALKRNNFFEKMLTCRLQCESCHYCGILFKKAVLINRDASHKRAGAEERKALRIYKNDLRQPYNNEKRARSCLKIAEAYLRLKRYKEAIKSIRKALKLNRKESGAYLTLGLCYERLKDYKQAIKALKKEEKADPLNREVKMALMRCYRSAGETGLFNKAIDNISREVYVRKNNKPG